MTQLGVNASITVANNKGSSGDGGGQGMDEGQQVVALTKGGRHEQVAVQEKDARVVSEIEVQTICASKLSASILQRRRIPWTSFKQKSASLHVPTR